MEYLFQDFKFGRWSALFQEFSEIDLFLPHLTCGRGRPVSAQLCVSYLSVTPSIQKFTSWIESFVDGALKHTWSNIITRAYRNLIRAWCWGIAECDIRRLYWVPRRPPPRGAGYYVQGKNVEWNITRNIAGLWCYDAWYKYDIHNQCILVNSNNAILGGLGHYS